MKPRSKRLLPGALGLLSFLGCATAREPAVPEDSTDREGVAEGTDAACQRRATVTVHVDNRGSADVQISFGPYTPVRAAPGFSKTTYDVPRPYLTDDIRLRIERGGLQLHVPPPVPTEFVACNDATLIIGARPRYSFFYGAKLIPVKPDGSGESEDES